MKPRTVRPEAPGPTAQQRVDWVDGIRGAAAIFVVLHHTWLSVWPAFPRNIGPWWLGWLLYGHLAVAVFIVVSGFSLSLAPARRSATLSGGKRRFIRRRAWRILPPYWAALIISTLVTWAVVDPAMPASRVARGFVVHGLLLQDITGSWVPNGAFWSIAVEWQIYFTFPLILWLVGKTTIRTAVVSTIALVLAAKALTALGGPFAKIDHLTPQFLALFAMGVSAAFVGRCELTLCMRRWLTVAGAAMFGLVLLGGVVAGSSWMVSNYFWVDLTFGGVAACFMTVMYGGGANWLRRLLTSRLALRLGLFSYSIYLVHAPLLSFAYIKIVHPLALPPLFAFIVLVVVAVPVIIAACYVFHLMFEAPFLHRRDLSALRELPMLTKVALRRDVDPPSPVCGADVMLSQEPTPSPHRSSLEPQTEAGHRATAR